MQVFISYRRTDQWVVDRISEALTDAFGQHAIFRDKEDLVLGLPFDDQLDEALGRCDVVLVVIGPGWVSALNERTGKSRLDDRGDFVRREIEAALKRPDVRVIPLFVGVSAGIEREHLPASLAGLVTRHGMPINPDPYFSSDMNRLVDSLSRPRPPQPGPPRPPRPAAPKVFSIGTGVLSLALVLALLAYRLWPVPPVPPVDGDGDGGGGPTTTTTNSIGMKFALIPPGQFVMGSDLGERRHGPAHPVRITTPFYFGLYEVARTEYQKVMDPASVAPGAENAGRGSPSRLPAEMVKWTDAVAFCNRLSANEKLAPYYRIGAEAADVTILGGTGYRLPTEAEWEYACRAGTTGRYFFGDDPSRLDDFAWFAGNSESRTHPVGTKSANPFGLFDTYGNVSEWCWDFYDAGYYTHSPADDPRNDVRSPHHVARGGSWKDDPAHAQSAWRDFFKPTDYNNFRGFRLARTGPAENPAPGPPPTPSRVSSN